MTWLVWAGFVLLVFGLMAFDLGVFSRGPKTLSAKTALYFTGFYFVLALCFTVFVYFAYENHWFDLGLGNDPNDPSLPDTGWEASAQFFMGYLLEQSLSVDNIFVIALILSYFNVSSSNQHRVLLWGILGALVMRGLMIAAGVALIRKFWWMTYAFGFLLIATAIKMLFAGEDEKADFDNSTLVRTIRRFFRFHPEFVEDHFFTRIDGKLAMTPLMLALIVVETTDLIFAIDSIPAVIGLTRDQFLVFTSNVFAILGLRSLYFALADLLGRFHLLKYSLVIILAFVGAKMMLEHFILERLIPKGEHGKAIVNVVSFAVIVLTLVGGIVASFIYPEHSKPEAEAPHVPV